MLTLEVKLMNKTIFGKFVADTRRELGMTQQELADRLYVTDKAVSKWERGLSYPDLTLFEKLAEALGITTAELVACQRDHTPEPDEKLDCLLDIALEANNDLSKRFHFRLWMLFGVLAVLLISILVYVCRTEVYDDYAMFWGKQTSEKGNYLYTVRNDRLLRLVCEDQAVFERIEADQESLYDVRYRWNPWTYTGTLLECVDLDLEGYSLMDMVNSQVNVGAMLSADYAFQEYHLIYPDPHREGGYLFTLRFFHYGNKYVNEADKAYEQIPILKVEDCRDWAKGDFDEDGVIELLVKTKYDEQPYMLYDWVDGQITSEVVEDMPKISQEDWYLRAYQYYEYYE